MTAPRATLKDLAVYPYTAVSRPGGVLCAECGVVVEVAYRAGEVELCRNDFVAKMKEAEADKQ